MPQPFSIKSDSKLSDVEVVIVRFGTKVYLRAKISIISCSGKAKKLILMCALLHSSDLYSKSNFIDR